MAPVNYLGRIQLVEIRNQATNKTKAQLLYLHYVGRNLDNDVSQQWHTISDVSTVNT